MKIHIFSLMSLSVLTAVWPVLARVSCDSVLAY